MLRVHFLNVGHGDTTVIAHPSGRLTMIDINNSQTFDQDTFNEELEEERKKNLMASTMLAGFPSTGLGDYAAVEARAKQELEDPIAFLKRTYPDRSLFRYIQTHPDLDHMRGLKALHENIGFANFWDTRNTKPRPPTFQSDADEIDWDFYQELRAGKHGLQPKNYDRGDSLYAFARDENGTLGGDSIEILSPTPQLVNTCNGNEKFNNISLVLRVQHAGKSVLLPGDIESPAWEDLVNVYGGNLKADFLKASHHGRDTGYHLKALQNIKPLVTVVSVGKKPDTDASNKYVGQSTYGVKSTRYHGNIELRIHDNGTNEWFVDRNWG